MTTATVSLSVNQWRLLNVLYRFARHVSGRPAPRMLAVAEASAEELLQLGAAGLVEAWIRDRQVDIKLATRPTASAVHLTLAPRGIGAVTGDPDNSALMTVADRPGQWVNLMVALRESSRFTDASIRTFIDLHRHGIVEIVLDGADVSIDQFRQPERLPPADLKVRPTAAGRYRAGI